MTRLTRWRPPSAALTLLNNMSTITQYLINQGGIPQEGLVLILMLPIAITIITLSRQIIGIKGFDIYTPLLIAFSFLAIGLKYGLIILFAAVLTGTILRLFIKKFRLLYLPRMAIIIIAIATLTLAAFYSSAYLKQNFIPSSIFAVVIIIILIEKFLAAQIERGARRAAVLTAETAVLSIICFLIINWSFLENFVLKYPVWFIAGSILANFMLGKWTGLRLFEYWRFREVIKHVELPKKK